MTTKLNFKNILSGLGVAVVLITSSYVALFSNASTGGDKPIVSITIDKNAISPGESVDVKYSSQGASSCDKTLGSYGWPREKVGPAGGFHSAPLYASTTYRITCSNSYGSTTEEVHTRINTENFKPPEFISFYAKPNPILGGQSTIIYWDIKNTNDGDCTANYGTNNWPGIKAHQGSLLTEKIYSPTQFLLQCSNLWGASVQTITVKVKNIEEQLPWIDKQ